jgi:hypothetical protein
MKTLKYLFGTVSVMMLGMFAATSCTDANDWDVDSSHERLFAPTGSISVESFDTYANISFKKVPGAKAYLVELCTDTLSDDNPEVSDNSIVEIFESNVGVVNNLFGETSYYLRVRAISDTKPESKWVYYRTGSGKGTFKTKAEQLFYPVTKADIFENAIHVTWQLNADVDRLAIMEDGDVIENVTLTDELRQAGEYTFNGLNPITTYTIEIYKGESTRRGQLKVTTAAAPPAASYTYELPAGADITGALLKEVAEKAKAASGSRTNYSATIVIPADAEVGFYTEGESGLSNVTIPDGMSVAFFGKAGGEAPTIKFNKNIELEGSHTFITFQNVKIVDNGAGYFVNQSKASTVGTFTIQDAEVSGFKTAFFRLQGNNEKTINQLVLDNSIFHDMCSGYSFIHVDASSGKGVVQNIKIHNCTVYNIATGGKMFIYSKNTDMQSIEIDYLTMYNSIGNNNYLIDFGSDSYGAESFVITNSIFAKTPDNVTKNIRAKIMPTYMNTFTTKDFFKTLKGAEALSMTSDELFKDPENANFTLTTTAIQAGDQRWIPEE